MPLNSLDAVGDDLIEIQQHVVHLNNQHHHTNSFVENINALLHGNIIGNSNGSHTGSGNGLTNTPTTEEFIEEELLVIIALLGSLFVTIGLIFLIAIAVSKMRRAESMHEVVGKNEFKLSTKTKKGLHHTPSNPLRFSSSMMKSSAHEVSTVPDLIHQHYCEGSLSPTTPKSSQSEMPPWFLQHSASFYRSQYHQNQINSLQNSYYRQGSLQSFHSMQSLNSSDHGSAPPSVSLSLSDTESEVTNISVESKKKKSSKKLKKVLQVMNIPKKIRQHQADKNRFNIYTIPTETREQLKQIYVY